MSKPYRVPSTRDRLRKQKISIKELQGLNRNRNTPRPVAATATSGFSAAGGTGGGTGNFLATQGDTMIGPIAVFPNQVLIEININGIADISQNTETAYTSYVRIDVTGPTNVLDTLAGAAFDGQLVWLENVGPMTIAQSTVGNGGNIVTADGNDIVFTNPQVTPMIFEASLVPTAGVQGGWRVIAGGGTGGGGGGVSFPIRPPVDNRGTVTTNQTFILSNSTGHILKFTLGANIDIIFNNFPINNIQQEWEVEIKQDATTSFVITWPASVVNPPTPSSYAGLGSTTIVVFRTNDGGTTIRVGNTVTTTAGVTTLSALTIDTTKDWGAFGITNISSITSSAADPAESGFIKMGNSEFLAWESNPASTTEGFFTYNNANNFLFGNGSLVPLTSGVESVGISAFRWGTFFGKVLDLENVTVLNVLRANLGASNRLTGITVAQGLAYFLGVKQTFQPGLLTPPGTDTFAGINVGSIATADPGTLVNGDMWYNSTDNKLRAQIAGSTVDLGTPTEINSISQGNSSVTVTDTGTGVVTTVVDAATRFQVQANRIDVEELPLFGLTALHFSKTGPIVASATVLTQNTNDFTMNLVNVADIYNIKFNSNVGLSVDQTKTQIYSTTPNTTQAILSMFRDDPSPSSIAPDDIVAQIEFRGRDTAVIQNNIVYGKVAVEIEDTTEALSTGSFQWTLRNLGLDKPMMSLREGVLAVTRPSETLAADRGAALVLVRNDTSFSIGDEAGELDFNIQVGATERVFGNISVTFDNTAVGDDSSRMDFKLLTDDVLQNILTIRASAITNNKIAIEIPDKSFIKTKSGVMGYFVTNDPLITSVIGSAGTMQIPQFSDGSPTLSQLNAAFGAFDGAIGQDIADGKLYVRKSSSAWSFYSESGTVI